MNHSAVVIGSSAGGLEALHQILSKLPASFPLPIIVAQHLSPRSKSYLVNSLSSVCPLKVREAEEKEKAIAGCVYTVTPNYHLMVEKDGCFSLSVEQRVSYARPSIDVLFETAADAFGKGLIGVILTGANQDGSKGIRAIQEKGGVTIVQNPDTAEVDFMPRAALKSITPDYIANLNEIAELLIMLADKMKTDPHHGNDIEIR